MRALGEAFKTGSPPINSHFSLFGRVSVKAWNMSTVIGPTNGIPIANHPVRLSGHA